MSTLQIAHAVLIHSTCSVGSFMWHSHLVFEHGHVTKVYSYFVLQPCKFEKKENCLDCTQVTWYTMFEHLHAQCLTWMLRESHVHIIAQLLMTRGRNLNTKWECHT